MPDVRPEETIDVGRFIGEAPWGGYQKLVLGLASLAFAMEGLAGQALGPALPALAKAWREPRGRFAPAAALGLVGFTLGATVGGALADRIGRRLTLIGSLIIFGLATAGCGVAHDIAQLSAWRIAAGLGLGASIPAGTALIADFTPARHRSTAIAIGVTFLPLGGFVAGLIAAYTLAHFDWRALFFATGVLPIVAAAGLIVALPESPRFLARSPARRPALLRLLGRMGRRTGPDAAVIDSTPAVAGNHFLALLAPDRVWDTIAIWGGFFGVVLGLYSVFNWAPTALAAKGFSLAAAGGAISAFSIGGVAGNAVSGALTERFGARVSIIVQTLLGVAGAAALAVVPARASLGHQAALAGLVLLAIGLSGAQTALYALAAHVYPPTIRSTGLGAAVAWGRIGAILSAYSGVIALDHGGPAAYFGVIGVALIAMMLFSLLARHGLPPARAAASQASPD